MGQWDVDFDDYEEKEGYAGENPKPGIYSAKLSTFALHNEDTGMLAFTFDITEGEYKGWRGWVYTNLTSTKWKAQQIVKAIQGGSEKPMSLNPDNAAKIVKNAKPVKIRLKNEKYEGQDRARIHTILPDEEAAKVSKVEAKKAEDVDPWNTED